MGPVPHPAPLRLLLRLNIITIKHSIVGKTGYLISPIIRHLLFQDNFKVTIQQKEEKELVLALTARRTDPPRSWHPGTTFDTIFDRAMVALLLNVKRLVFY